MFASRVCLSLHKIEHVLDAFTDVGLMPTLSETGSVSTRIKTDRSPSVYQRDIWNTDATWADGYEALREAKQWAQASLSIPL